MATYTITVHAAKASDYDGAQCVSYEPMGLDGTRHRAVVEADNFDALHEEINAVVGTLGAMPLADDPYASADAVDVFAVIVGVARGQRKPRGFDKAFGEMIVIPRKEVSTTR